MITSHNRVVFDYRFNDGDISISTIKLKDFRFFETLRMTTTLSPQDLAEGSLLS